jgi:hypothetical protein
LKRFSAICPHVALELTASEQPGSIMSAVQLSVAIRAENPLAARETISPAGIKGCRLATGDHPTGHERCSTGSAMLAS